MRIAPLREVVCFDKIEGSTMKSRSNRAERGRRSSKRVKAACTIPKKGHGNILEWRKFVSTYTSWVPATPTFEDMLHFIVDDSTLTKHTTNGKRCLRPIDHDKLTVRISQIRGSRALVVFGTGTTIYNQIEIGSDGQTKSLSNECLDIKVSGAYSLYCLQGRVYK